MSGRLQLLIELGYRGEPFYGLAPQPGLPTVHAALAARIEAATAQPPRRLVFAARTDRGVHARHNVATCYLRDVVDPEAIRSKIAAARDDGLVVQSVRLVDKHVFARTLAHGKHYRYQLARLTDETPSARAEVWALPDQDPLDFAAMRRAAADLVGVHDFTSFGVDSAGKDPNKNLWRVALSETEAGLQIDVEGSAFLRHMVRILVGTLVEVGRGVRHPETMPLVLAARDRLAAGSLAPAAGLTLWRVLFDEALVVGTQSGPSSEPKANWRTTGTDD